MRKKGYLNFGALCLSASNMPCILEGWYPNTKDVEELISDYENNYDFITYLICQYLNINVDVTKLSEDQKQAFCKMFSCIISKSFFVYKINHQNSSKSIILLI